MLWLNMKNESSPKLYGKFEVLLTGVVCLNTFNNSEIIVKAGLDNSGIWLRSPGAGKRYSVSKPDVLVSSSTYDIWEQEDPFVYVRAARWEHLVEVP